MASKPFHWSSNFLDWERRIFWFNFHNNKVACSPSQSSIDGVIWVNHNMWGEVPLNLSKICMGCRKNRNLKKNTFFLHRGQSVGPSFWPPEDLHTNKTTSKPLESQFWDYRIFWVQSSYWEAGLQSPCSPIDEDTTEFD